MIEQEQIEVLKAQVNCLREILVNNQHLFTKGAQLTIKNLLDALPWQCLAEVKAKEINEASKPKPEPVGYIVQEAVQDNTFITGKACVMIRSKPSANSTVPVYTTQPAREPLSNEQIIEIADKTQTAESGVNGYILPIAYAREIEKAHGITE